jgi:hypothetical protein
VAQRHGVSLRFGRVGDTPRLEAQIDRCVEPELALLNQLQRGGRGDRLADRSGLEKGVGRSSPSGHRVCNAESARPSNPIAAKDRYADGRDMMAAHQLSDTFRFVGPALHLN